MSTFLNSAIAADVDDSVMIRFIRVFVDETSRVDTGHLSVVKSGDSTECTGVGDATILREADWLAIDLLIPR